MLTFEVTGIAAAENISIPSLPVSVTCGNFLFLVRGKGVAAGANAKDGLARLDVFSERYHLRNGGRTTPHADEKKVGILKMLFKTREVMLIVFELNNNDLVALLKVLFKEGRKSVPGFVFPLGNEREDLGFSGDRKDY